MANLRIYRGFDMGGIDLSMLFPSSTTVSTGANMTLDGTAYADIAQGRGGIVAGRDFVVEGNGVITAGIVQGLFIGDGHPVASDPVLAISDLSAPLSLFAAATRSTNQADDVEELHALLSGNDALVGSSGSDKLYGFAGDDTIDGGAGNDWLYGDAGNDVLIGGAGADKMFGGAGDDTYYIDNRADRIYENVGNASSVDTGGNDTVHTPFSINLNAYRGLQFVDNVVLEGNGALNAVGNGLANALTGTDARNVLRGMDGRDTLMGLGGDDLLLGGPGNDVLTGGKGRDVITGGEGHDTFVFAPDDFAGLTWATADRITDFRSTQNDRIDLSAFGGSLTFVYADAFDGKAPELRYENNARGLLLQGDANGDGVADFAVRLDGVHVMHATDLIL